MKQPDAIIINRKNKKRGRHRKIFWNFVSAAVDFPDVFGKIPTGIGVDFIRLDHKPLCCGQKTTTYPFRRGSRDGFSIFSILKLANKSD